MATAVLQSFGIFNSDGIPDAEIYTTKDNEVVFTELQKDFPSFFFKITKQEWEDLKKFVDENLNK